MNAPFCVIIPARYGSQRLPGKALLEIAGKPMIQHVCERARASAASRVVVATDDSRIAQAVKDCADAVCMTSAAHRSGTDRVQEAATQLDLDPETIVVNVQGDEPLLPAALIDQAAAALSQRRVASMATLCEAFCDEQAMRDKDVVKVTRDEQGFALYFSRAPIPFPSAADASWRGYRHIGIYAYRVEFLARFVAWPPVELEVRESLEQLRALARGARVYVAEAQCAAGLGVDTLSDLNRVREQLGGL